MPRLICQEHLFPEVSPLPRPSDVCEGAPCRCCSLPRLSTSCHGPAAHSTTSPPAVQGPKDLIYELQWRPLEGRWHSVRSLQLTENTEDTGHIWTRSDTEQSLGHGGMAPRPHESVQFENPEIPGYSRILRPELANNLMRTWSPWRLGSF